MMVHLGVEHPLRQALLQLVDQTPGLEHHRRICPFSSWSNNSSAIIGLRS
jgi:hypothetical protein